MKLFKSVSNFCKKMEWKEVALDEICCCAFGLAVGLCVPAKKRAPLLLGAAAVAVAACVPLVVKIANSIEENKEASWEDEVAPV